MKEPVLILSDLHLGHPASRIDSAEQLRPLLEGAGTAVFNGDTYQELATSFRPRADELLQSLKDLCLELGVEMRVLPGNHDPGWEGQGWLELENGRIVVTHGDSVMWSGSPWSRESFERRDQVRELWEGNRAADTDPVERLSLARKLAILLRAPTIPKGRSFLRRVIDALSPPRRSLEILRIWFSQADRAAEFAERYFPRSEVLILGHFHWRGIWNRSGRLILNTGAYASPHHANWISYEAGWLKVGSVEERDGQFLKGNVVKVWSMGR